MRPLVRGALDLTPWIFSKSPAPKYSSSKTVVILPSGGVRGYPRYSRALSRLSSSEGNSDSRNESTAFCPLSLGAEPKVAVMPISASVTPRALARRPPFRCSKATSEKSVSA